MGNDDFGEIIKSVKESAQNITESNTESIPYTIPIINDGLSTERRSIDISGVRLSTYANSSTRFTTSNSSCASNEKK